jgi:alpha-galactosidase
VLWHFKGLDDVEAQTHMTLWSMMAAPLLASHDLSSADAFDTALLTNPHVLAVDQDELGQQARPASPDRTVWQLVKPLADGGVAVSFTNVGRRTRTASADLGALASTPDLAVVDAWTGEAVDGTRVSCHLARHGSAMFVGRPAS